MNTDAFEKTNWVWQFYLFQEKVGEWFEYQFSRFQKTLPELLPGWSISPWVAELLKILFWLILGLFVVWVIWRLWQEFNTYIYAWLARFDHAFISQNKNQANELSISLLLTKAQEFYQQGNYQEACRYLYLAMLQQLHEKAIAPQQPSRTDGEYLQLLTSSVTPVQPYETLITTHEQLCFGNNEILAENYQQCHQAYQELFNS
ncbi:DUF4129 domain-containing protein [Sphaerospermopsis kisseleviana CS-549]|uniref:DUF4129 domain-containing protein n=1 Tax=Sphaerospermopsis kisseleviana CS-549 TaxID=3021783 RepID=A0ABT4ZWZ8_9CYAN|nr:DUF4129 domain-containing protein [Sphaerospermopsis kisseleviana]MDB9443544.1 DUF4129 domain-containing protein [Sphaerospermopsis kisseleviana CS-549]BAZ83033.1 hypothetical protein NIES73_43160 [Sphaerospermopsis kisseleviana NIES-73]